MIDFLYHNKQSSPFVSTRYVDPKNLGLILSCWLGWELMSQNKTIFLSSLPIYVVKKSIQLDIAKVKHHPITKSWPSIHCFYMWVVYSWDNHLHMIMQIQEITNNRIREAEGTCSQHTGWLLPVYTLTEG